MQAFYIGSFVLLCIFSSDDNYIYAALISHCWTIAQIEIGQTLGTLSEITIAIPEALIQVSNGSIPVVPMGMVSRYSKLDARSTFVTSL